MTAPNEAYRNDGYVALPQFLPRQVATAWLARLKDDLAAKRATMDALNREGPLLRGPAAEMYGHHYRRSRCRVTR